MPITIGSNIASLVTQRNLSETTTKQMGVYERLASGMRINKASDDAAGLSVATTLNADAKIFSRSLLNVNDGISMLNIADGALDALSTVVTRMQELATQSANGSYSNTQRSALNQESNALLAEYNRIVASTTYNGQQLLKANSSPIGLAVGLRGADSISFDIGKEFARIVGDGTFQTGITINAGGGGASAMATGDFNGDGIADFMTTGGNLNVYLGNGDGTFRLNSYSAGGSWDLQLGDLNNDGVQDVVTSHVGWDRITILLGNADGSFGAPTQIQATSNDYETTTIGDFDGDGKLDIATAHQATNRLVILRGNGNGTFQAAISQAVAFAPESPMAADFNGDGLADLMIKQSNFSADAVQIWLSNGDGSFRLHQNIANQSTGNLLDQMVGDLDNDGDMDFVVSHYNGSENVTRVFLNNGSGTFTLGQELGGMSRVMQLSDINGDGILDHIAGGSGGAVISYGNGDGTFKASATFSGTTAGVAADFTGDGAADLVGLTGGGQIQFHKAGSTESTALPYLDIRTQAKARQAMGILSAAATRISQERGSLGAFMSRLSITTSNIRNQRDQYLAAASRIQDTDVAEDAALLVRTQILQKAGVAILAQANLQPQIALDLLKSSR